MKIQITTENEYIHLITEAVERASGNSKQEAITIVTALRKVGTPVAQGLYSRFLRACIVDLEQIEQKMKDELVECKKIRANGYSRNDYEEIELTDDDYKLMIDERIALCSNARAELEKHAAQSLASVKAILSEYQAGTKFVLSALGEARYSSAGNDQYRTTKKTKDIVIDNLQQLPSAIRDWIYELSPAIEYKGHQLHLKTVTVELNAKLKDYSQAHATFKVLDFGNAAQFAELFDFHASMSTA